MPLTQTAARAILECDDDDTFICERCLTTFPERVMDSQVYDLHPVYKCVCPDCAEPLLIGMGA